MRKKTRDALIDAGWRFGSCVGLGLGLIAALDMRPDTPASCSQPGDPSAPLEGCISDGVVAAALPYVVCMGLGLLLGAVIGALGARAICVLWAVATDRPGAAAAPVAVAGPTGRRMVARYESSCSACGGSISVGSLIEHLGPKQTICQRCVAPVP